MDPIISAVVGHNKICWNWDISLVKNIFILVENFKKIYNKNLSLCTCVPKLFATQFTDLEANLVYINLRKYDWINWNYY